MKAAAVLLALLTAFPAALPAAEPLVLTSTAAALGEPITIVAPRVKEEAVLKTARAAGTGTAVVGGGLMVYAFAFGAAGPVGWAAGLLFAGGLTAYLSHRRLRGKEDFSTTAGLEKPAPKTAAASAERR